VATSEIADDGSFAVTLPEAPAGAFALVEPDPVSTFPCDASRRTMEPSGAALLVAGFETGAGGTLAHGVQQGASRLCVTPVVGDLLEFYVYADRALRVRGSASCPAIPFVPEYDHELAEGWSTLHATFVSRTGAPTYEVTSAEPPTEAILFQPDGGP
jgi:hypothetical protein